MDGFTGTLNLYFLGVVLAAAIGLEALLPWRRLPRVDVKRWLLNGSMLFYTIVIMSLLPVLSSLGAALFAQQASLGLLNYVSLLAWVSVACAVIVLDGLAYAEHRFLHRYYPLWRTHRVHHADRIIDATTSVRFHPFEAVLRTALEAPLIVMLGLPPEGIAASFALRALANTFTHANLRVPLGAERLLSLVLVTPRIHRLHHAMAPERLHSNFGTVFSFWDRLFGTFTPPQALREGERFGIDGPEQIETETFANLALDPFRRSAAAAIPGPETDSPRG
jgi:sterol desaturase/sphingolipid hydroxylase (fatty acid hydroxylase superfamily)